MDRNFSISGHIVDVLGKRIFDGEVTVENGRIVSVEACEVEAGAPYIMPGFVDSHIHIESTLLLPENYAKIAVSQGTVAAVTDPHEIANVLGVSGVDYMVKNGGKVRFHFRWGVPSCVPSTTFETAGATLDADAVKELVLRDEFFGLAEMMNFPGVVYNDKQTMDKINCTLECGKKVDGHAPGISGETLKAYAGAGISTDHECSSLEEAVEKLGLGMKIIIREGSAACNFETLCGLLADYPQSLMFCSDDKYPDELKRGYINEMAALAVAKGFPLWNILNAACLTPVLHYGIGSGLLRTGDSADFICVSDLKDFKVLKTFIEGVEVYSDGNVSDDIYVEGRMDESAFPNNFNTEKISAEDLRIVPQEGRIKVMVASDGSLYTGVRLEKPVISPDGNVISDPENDILKICVYNRYSKDARPATGFINGFGIKCGAIASTIAHDSHNIVAIGCDDESMVKAVNTLVESKGGLCAYNGKETTCVELPVAGLMSPLDGDKVAENYERLKQVIREMGCGFNGPFMTMAFMALPVIPELKLTDISLFDFKTFGFTDLFTTPDPEI